MKKKLMKQFDDIYIEMNDETVYRILRFTLRSVPDRLQRIRLRNRREANHPNRTCTV